MYLNLHKLMFLLLLIFCNKLTFGFKWNNIDEVNEFYKNMTVNIKAFFGGDCTANEFTERVKMADDFEEYVFDSIINGKEMWLKTFNSVPNTVESWDGIYDIEIWHSRYSLASFIYFYNFIDGTQLIARGKTTAILNDKGELKKWIYFSQNGKGSLENVVEKFNQLSQESFLNENDNKEDL